jgi:hypothetical protein
MNDSYNARFYYKYFIPQDSLLEFSSDEIIYRLNDTIIIKDNKKYIYKLKVHNPGGKASLIIYNNKSNTIYCKGQYSESLDTLREYRTYDNFLPPYETSCKIVIPFFEPLLEGRWIYYKNDSISHIDYYRCGTLINSYRDKTLKLCPN